MRGISKRFGRLVANDAVDLDLWPGEIHGLLGENGAGKTTLMNILSGLLGADEGTIEVDGRVVSFGAPKDAMRLGIQMVHQHFMLVTGLSVTENVILGPRRRSGWLVDSDTEQAAIRQISERYGLPIDPTAPVERLPVELQQRVEIIKALYRGSRILILDEPTAVLAPQEVDQFLAMIRRLADAGQAVVLITHRIEEAKRFTDRVTVLRDGGRVAAERTAEVSGAQLGGLMVGRQIPEVEHPTRGDLGKPVLQLRGVNLDASDGTRLAGLDLQVRAGEIVGVVGVAGNGQTELEEVLIGLRQPTAGKVHIAGRTRPARSARELLDGDVGYIPGDRTRHGVIHELSVEDNLALGVYRLPGYRRWRFVRRARIRREVIDTLDRFRVAAQGPTQRAGELSGGNQQKLLLARALWRNPRLVLAVNPTRGLDVGATRDIHRELVAQAAGGAAVLLMSTDLAEVLTLSRRVAVLSQGRFVGEVAPSVGAEELGQLMAGVHTVEGVS
jgi:simple sugar transport system ATP-binding protein